MNCSDRLFLFWWLAATVIAVLIALLAPPFSLPDEGAHFLRSTEISRLHLVNSTGNIGVDIPCNEYLTIAKKYAPIAYFQAVESRHDFESENCKVKSVNSAGMYSPLPYVFSAIGIALAEQTGTKVENRLRIARLFNALASSVICLLALFWVRRWREILSIFALLPMSIWLRSSLSADSMTIAFSIAFLGYILYLIEEEVHIAAKQIYTLSLIAAMLGSMKLVTGVLCLSSILAYDKAQTSRKDKMQLLILPGLFAIASGLFWAKLADPSLVYIGNGANPVAQLSFIIGSPYQYLMVIKFTLWNTLESLLYTATIPGIAAPRQVPLNLGIAFTTILSILLAVLATSTANKLNTIHRTILLAVSCLIILASVTPLYLTYTPPGHSEILGLQGRYFLPAALCFVLAVSFSRPQYFYIKPELRTNIGMGIPAIINMVILWYFSINGNLNYTW